jgi:hypothetical protein
MSGMTKRSGCISSWVEQQENIHDYERQTTEQTFFFRVGDVIISVRPYANDPVGEPDFVNLSASI